MANIKYKRGTSDTISQIGIQDGQVLFAMDTGELFIDSGEANRKKVTDITKADKTTVNELSNTVENNKQHLQEQIDLIASASDVVDVVANYEALRNYDTSKLTANDIVKVLDDEEHNHAITYYRWNNQWEYIGETPAYYNKTEIDQKMERKANYTDLETIDDHLRSHQNNKNNPHDVTAEQIGLDNVDNTSDLNKPISTATQAALDNKVDKVSGKGLSTNDFTNADKEKLDSIENVGVGKKTDEGGEIFNYLESHIIFNPKITSDDLVKFDGINDEYARFDYTKGWGTLPAGSYTFTMDCHIYSGTPVIRVGQSATGARLPEQDNYVEKYDAEHGIYTITFDLTSNFSGNLGVRIGNYGTNGVFVCAHPKLALNGMVEDLLNEFNNNYYYSSNTVQANKWNRRSSASGGYSCNKLTSSYVQDILKELNIYGNSNLKAGYLSHTEGSGTWALAKMAHAEGRGNNFECTLIDYSDNTIFLTSKDGNSPENIKKNAIIAIETEPNSNVYVISYTIDGAASVSGNNYLVHVNSDNLGTIQTPANVKVIMGGSTSSLAHTEGNFTNAVDLTATDLKDTADKKTRQHAEGSRTLAAGYAAHAEGEYSRALGNQSHAEGENTEAQGVRSHAEGKDTIASGDSSHVEGNGNQAAGDNSHAGGQNSYVETKNSFVNGTGINITSHKYQNEDGKYIEVSDNSFAIGQYNKNSAYSEKTSGGTTILIYPIFQIGNGINNNSRSNCFEVLPNGEIISQDITTSLQNKNNYGKGNTLTPKQYVDTELNKKRNEKLIQEINTNTILLEPNYYYKLNNNNFDTIVLTLPENIKGYKSTQELNELKNITHGDIYIINNYGGTLIKDNNILDTKFNDWVQFYMAEAYNTSSHWEKLGNSSNIEIQVVFTTGSTLLNLRINGEYEGETLYIPSKNSICELTFRYINDTWVLSTKETSLNKTIKVLDVKSGQAANFFGYRPVSGGLQPNTKYRLSLDWEDINNAPFSNNLFAIYCYSGAWHNIWNDNTYVSEWNINSIKLTHGYHYDIDFTTTNPSELRELVVMFGDINKNISNMAFRTANWKLYTRDSNNNLIDTEYMPDWTTVEFRNASDAAINSYINTYSNTDKGMIWRKTTMDNLSSTLYGDYYFQ